MPLVNRKIVVENENTTFSKDIVDHTLYVAPEDMRPGDVEVDPVSTQQLAELAQMYPKEYGQKAKDAGVEPQVGSGRLAQLIALPAKELAKKIGDMHRDVDEEILWGIYEFEVNGTDEGEGGEERVTVLNALEAKGIKE